MAHPDQHGADERSDSSGTPKGRRRARVLIPLGLLLIAAALITYMLVIAQTGTDDDEEIYDNEGAASALLVEVPVPALR